MGSSASKAIADAHAMRIGFLFLGYRCRPCSLALNGERTCVFCYEVPATVSWGERQLMRRWCKCPNQGEGNCDHFTELRFFAAIRTGSKRFLRLGDDDTTALLRYRNDEAGTALADAYLTRANDLGWRAEKEQLAALIGLPPTAWIPAQDEIHVIVVYVRDRPVYPLHIVLNYQGYEEQAMMRPKLRNPKVLTMLHGSSRDLYLHGTFNPSFPPQYHLIKDLTPEGPRSCEGISLASFPRFDEIAVTRLYCGASSDEACDGEMEPQLLMEPPSLKQLAEEALIRAILNADPPMYMDGIDCVADVDLYHAGRRVSTNVMCFIVFEQHSTARSTIMPSPYKVCVNPEMLSCLESIVKLTNPCRPRMVMILSTNNGKEKRDPSIDRSWLPTEIPTILTRYFTWFEEGGRRQQHKKWR